MSGPTGGEADSIERAFGALKAVESYCQSALAICREDLAYQGQRPRHGLAWTFVLAEGLVALTRWASGLRAFGALQSIDIAIVEAAFQEYLGQLIGGIPVSQLEMIRPDDVGGSADLLRSDPSVAWFLSAAHGARGRLADALLEGARPSEGTGDETIDAVRDVLRRFSSDQIIPHAQTWHLENALLPDAVLESMSALGVFGLPLSADYGGTGLGKLAMCVASEELSRGWLAVGSVGTRSEIAGELIAQSGTEAQREQWLPGIASGAVLPTAVFTEAGAGSDLSAVSTRAVKLPDGRWRIDGTKLWITHAARADLMVILARTDTSDECGRELSIFLAPKPRSVSGPRFSIPGLTGSEIEVLGYRGMKEYELSFDGFEVPADGLLGGVTGQGFRQLLGTFESARIQTAARAVGVASRALDLSVDQSNQREQFGRNIGKFERVADKLAMMATEIVVARELSYLAARRKDEGRRCDLEAGMAKLLASRAAWSCADGAVQIHGGSGFALEAEPSRLLCDARVLSIFEGASEIQAEIVSRRILERSLRQ
ncbi:acyl-CoA dehydrogenase [Sphingobium lactosutens]|nr:acyl-CoA dehydrogenase [Sphingobium lactosutens]